MHLITSDVTITIVFLAIGFVIQTTIAETIQTNEIANPVPHALGDQEQLGDRNLKDHDPQVHISVYGSEFVLVEFYSRF